MIDIIQFNNRPIRMSGTPESPEWVGKDVCELLGYKHHKPTLRLIPPEEKGTTICSTLGGLQEMTTVTEPGLYRLIFGSEILAARDFQSFVFNEVLPSIRKYGYYAAEKTVAARFLELTHALQQTKMLPRESHRLALKLLQFSHEDEELGDMIDLTKSLIGDGGDIELVQKITREIPKKFKIYLFEKNQKRLNA